MKKAISTEHTPQNVARVLALLAETPERLAALSQGRSNEALRWPPGPGERSFAETLAHLINTEWRASEAIVLALTTREPLLPTTHAEREYGKLLRHDRMSVEAMLAYFAYRRAVLLRVLHALTAEQWARTVREEEKARRESVYRLARGMALHEMEHLAAGAMGDR